MHEREKFVHEAFSKAECVRSATSPVKSDSASSSTLCTPVPDQALESMDAKKLRSLGQVDVSATLGQAPWEALVFLS